LDYGIVLAYLLFLVLLGLYLRKRASASMENYFLADRKLPWWILGISGMGWSLDVTGTMLIVSLLFLLGPRGLFIEFRGGVQLSLIFMMIWTGKWHRRSGCMTIAEWMSYRFGEGTGGNLARIISAIAGIITNMGMLAYMIVGIGLFLSMFIPLSPLQCSLIMVGVASAYTISSGFYGVVFSDFFQCGIIFVAIVLITILALTKACGQEVVVAAQSITGISEWGTSFPQMHAQMPKAYEAYECLFKYTFFLLLRNIIGGFGTGGEPHFFAARNERECGKLACLWSLLMTLRWPMMMSLVILGVFLVKNWFPEQEMLSHVATLIKQEVGQVDKSQWSSVLSQIANSPQNYSNEFIRNVQSILGSGWTEKIKMVSFEGTINAESVMPAVLLTSIPAGVRGIILVGLIAASMSTFDTTLNKTTALFTRDIYQRYLRPLAKNKELMFATYTFSVFLVASAFFLVSRSTSINDIWGWIIMGLGSGLAIPMFMRLYWWRFNGVGFTVATVAGLLGALIQRFFWPDLPEQTQFVLLTLISLLFAIIGTYLGKPTDEKVLRHFYMTTRPFGLWRVIEKRCPNIEKEKMKKEHQKDLIALPFGLIWMISLFLIPMQIMIGNIKALSVTIILFTIGIWGLYKFWYKNLPDND